MQDYEHNNREHEYDFLLSSPLVFDYDYDDNTATIVEEIVLEKFQDKLEEIYNNKISKVARRRNKSGPGRLCLEPEQRQQSVKLGHVPFVTELGFDQNREDLNGLPKHYNENGSNTTGNGPESSQYDQEHQHRGSRPEELFFYDHKVTLTKYKSQSDTSLNQFPDGCGSRPAAALAVQSSIVSPAIAKTTTATVSKEIHRDYETTAVYQDQTTLDSEPLVFNDSVHSHEYESTHSSAQDTPRSHAGKDADADMANNNKMTTKKAPNSSRSTTKSSSSKNKQHGRGPEFYLAPFSPTAAATVTGAKTIFIRYKPKKLASVSSSASLLSDDYDSQSTSMSMSPSPSPDPAQLDKWALEPRTPSPSPPEEFQLKQNSPKPEFEGHEQEQKIEMEPVPVPAVEELEVNDENSTLPAPKQMSKPAVEIPVSLSEEAEAVRMPKLDRTEEIRKEIGRAIQQAVEIDNVLNEPVIQRKGSPLALNEDEAVGQRERENEPPRPHPRTQTGSLSLEENKPETKEAIDVIEVIDDIQHEKSQGRERETFQETRTHCEDRRETSNGWYDTKAQPAPESSAETRPRQRETRTVEVKICMVKVTREETHTRKSLYNEDSKSTDLDANSDSESKRPEEPAAEDVEEPPPPSKDTDSVSDQHQHPGAPDKEQEPPTTFKDSESEPPVQEPPPPLPSTTVVSDQHPIAAFEEPRPPSKSVRGPKSEALEAEPRLESIPPTPAEVTEQETEIRTKPPELDEAPEPKPLENGDNPAPTAANDYDIPVGVPPELSRFFPPFMSPSVSEALLCKLAAERAKIESRDHDQSAGPTPLDEPREPEAHVQPQPGKAINSEVGVDPEVPEVEEPPTKVKSPERNYAAVAAAPVPVPVAKTPPTMDTGMNPSASPKPQKKPAKAPVSNTQAKPNSKPVNDASGFNNDLVKLPEAEGSKVQSAPESPPVKAPAKLREPVHDVKANRHPEPATASETKPKRAPVISVKAPETREEIRSTPSPSPSPSTPTSKSRKKKAKKVTFDTDIDVDNNNQPEVQPTKASKSSQSSESKSKFKASKKCLTNSLPAGSPVPTPTGGYFSSLISDAVVLACELIMCVVFITMCFTSSTSTSTNLANLAWAGCASFFILLVPVLMSSRNRPEHRHRLANLIRAQWPDSSLIQFAGNFQVLHPILWTGVHYKTARAYAQKSGPASLSKFAQVRQFYREHVVEDGPGLIGKFFLQTLVAIVVLALTLYEGAGGKEVCGVYAASGLASGLAAGRWTWLRVRTQGRLILD